MKIVVTGASGFVGQSLVRQLAARHEVNALSRRPCPVPPGVKWAPLGDLSEDQHVPLPGCDTVVHLAAVAHVPAATAPQAQQSVLKINAIAPVEAAARARAAGARRFVFVSSIKAIAERSTAPLREDAPAQPEDLYGKAKHAAEVALLSEVSGIGVVIVRPPIVYGPGVRANFQRLIRLVRSGYPLPFGSVDNRRSLVGTDNFSAFLELAAAKPGLDGKILHVTDGRSLSTAELVRLIAEAAGRRPRLWPFPQQWLDQSLRMLGRAALADRLLGTLELDDSLSRQLTGFVPPLTVEEGIARTVSAD